MPAAVLKLEPRSLALEPAHGQVRLEEHVLVKVRKAVKLGRLGERTITDREFDRHERNGRIGQNDHLKAVRQRLGDERNVVFLCLCRLKRRRPAAEADGICRLGQSGLDKQSEKREEKIKSILSPKLLQSSNLRANDSRLPVSRVRFSAKSGSSCTNAFAA